MSGSERLTVGQALIRFLAAQRVERDGVERPFFAGCLGIFGHGNLAGVGQALQEHPDFRFVPARNEQAMVHLAAGYAKASLRLSTWACTASVGPGSTNMLTAAAAATINRIPVLLLPGDVFATRRVDPVLQQLEHPSAGDVSVNDAFRPVSRWFDRIVRPEQLVPSALQALRVLTDPAETGTVTLALPQDVQAEAWTWPAEFLAERVWRVRRPRPDEESLGEAATLLRAARRPLAVAGGGVLYSDATEALRAFAEATGIPVAETQAGKGALPFDHPRALGAVGATGTPGANELAAEADLVLGIGTRWGDFATASRTLFAHPGVRFVNVNVAASDGHKLAGLPLVGDARATLEALTEALAGHAAVASWTARAAAHNEAWDLEVERLVTAGHGPLPSQAEVIGVVNAGVGTHSVVVNAAGSLPGDLHKLWRTREPGGYHLEYGYSCMGYEVPAGIGVKLADPSREVVVMVGDGSWLMMPSELVTALQEGVKLIVVLVDNRGYASIGSLSRSLGSGGFGTQATVTVDLAANAASLGAHVIPARTVDDLRTALGEARSADRATVITVETDPSIGVPSHAWWDVPIAEVSSMPEVQAARAAYSDAVTRIRPHLDPPRLPRPEPAPTGD